MRPFTRNRLRLLLAILSPAMLTLAVPLANRVDPRIFGFPFLLVLDIRLGGGHAALHLRSLSFGRPPVNHAAVALGIVGGHDRGNRRVCAAGRASQSRWIHSSTSSGGRSFGTVFLWILLAGEIYTSFTVLGAAGWAYGKGAPAFYILAYGAVAYLIGYFYFRNYGASARSTVCLRVPTFFSCDTEARC